MAYVHRSSFLVSPVTVQRLCAGLALSLTIVCASSAAPQRPAAAPDSSIWEDIVLPGGADALLEAAGISSSIEDWRAVPVVIEQFYGGLNARLPPTFERYGAGAHDTGDSRAPLPLGREFWLGVLETRQPAEPLIRTILSRRAAASLYYGLLCMDTATLHAVRANADIASVLVSQAERLPVHAKALRIREGRIDPAGGDTLAPLWADLVGPLERPAAFIEQLLTRDDGRLGYFYNTLDALPRAGIRFVRGPQDVDEAHRKARFKALYAAFATSLPTWDGRQRRFFPVPGGPAEALFAIAVRDDGSLAGPAGLAFWERALLGSSRTARNDRSPVADAAEVLRIVCSAAGCDDEKVRTLTFIQRQADDSSASNLDRLVEVARVRLRFPALALELEHLRLDDLSIYPAAGRAAAQIEDLPRDRRRDALLQFQGGISLLCRLRETGQPAERVHAYLAALLALPIHRDGYRGGVLRWLVTDVLNTPPSEALDDAAIRMLAGAAPAGPIVEWEGLRYRVDTTATESERIRSALARFERHDLSTAWTRLASDVPGGDAAGAQAIATLVYGVALHDPLTPLALSRGLPGRHDLFSRLPGDALPPSWTLPSVRFAASGVRHLGGALLTLAIGAPELATRRLDTDRPRERARISPVLADGLLRTAVLTSLWTDTADAGSRVVAAATRGTELARESQRLEAVLADAGITGPRAGWIRWANARGTVDPVSVLRLEDFVRLGDPSLRVTNLGAATVPFVRLGLDLPSITWEMRGQPPDHRVAAALAVEAPLRVASELRARNLPTVLAAGVLAMLATDIVEGGSLAHPADVHGVADSVRRVPAARFDDYIAAVAARGPLVPVSSGVAADR